jgi:transglutaminase-like putative cysteine protease/predicted glutamine amidotransferase
MPNLLAISFEGALAPSFDLRCLHQGGKLPDGWGIGYYPGGEPSASVLKEPAPRAGSIRSELVKAWEHLESSVFVLHIRTATWGAISDANTQPFVRTYAGRDYLFGHSGSLKDRLALPAERSPAFEPVGSTDTELVFCSLLARFAAEEKRSLGDVDPDVLLAFFDDLSEHGGMTSVLTDGRDLVVYADKKRDGAIYLASVIPPYERAIISDEELTVDLFGRGTKSRKGILVSSSPLAPEPGVKLTWEPLEAGRLLVVREGAIVADAGPAAAAAPARRPSEPTQKVTRTLPRPRVAAERRLRVVHRTSYRYDKPVERSSHLLRLAPIHDRLQSVEEHSIAVSADGKARDYDDVFGNRVRRIEIDTPFTEMTIEARSVVHLLDTDPLSFRPLHKRWTIPLVWMPWQRHMLQPYLLPEELPDSQLEELTEYTMSFVERNDYDLFDTLLDINATIHREYAYRQGATTIHTTPFDVYEHRRGVCQDFSNLFICLARLLSVPARYVCGYVYTGPKHENTRQAEASHAWVQVYLPEVGWKGFDPTNGVMTQTDHVRVAVGRNYVDATPTSGTLFLGGGRETLEVDVRCDVIST